MGRKNRDRGHSECVRAPGSRFWPALDVGSASRSPSEIVDWRAEKWLGTPLEDQRLVSGRTAVLRRRIEAARIDPNLVDPREIPPGIAIDKSASAFHEEPGPERIPGSMVLNHITTPWDQTPSLRRPPSMIRG